MMAQLSFWSPHARRAPQHTINGAQPISVAGGVNLVVCVSFLFDGHVVSNGYCSGGSGESRRVGHAPHR